MTDWETRYYEAEANHTEANGMLTAENARLRRALSDARKALEEIAFGHENASLIARAYLEEK